MKIYELRLRFHWGFVPKGPINNISALVQIMAWHRPGDKPLSEAMLVSLLMHIFVTRPQWVNRTLLSSSDTVTSHERYGFSDHQLVDYLFSSLFRPAMKKTSLHYWLCEGNLLVTSPSSKDSNMERFQCPDAMYWNGSVNHWALFCVNLGNDLHTNRIVFYVHAKHLSYLY